MATVHNNLSFCPALLWILAAVLSGSSKHHDPLGTDHLSLPRFLIACQSRRKQTSPFPDDPLYDLPYGKYLSVVRDMKKKTSIQHKKKTVINESRLSQFFHSCF